MADNECDSKAKQRKFKVAMKESQNLNICILVELLSTLASTGRSLANPNNSKSRSFVCMIRLSAESLLVTPRSSRRTNDRCSFLEPAGTPHRRLSWTTKIRVSLKKRKSRRQEWDEKASVVAIAVAAPRLVVVKSHRVVKQAQRNTTAYYSQ